MEIEVLVYELAALGAATCWAATGLLAVRPAAHLGALAFNRFRQVLVTAGLAIYVLATGEWRTLGTEAVVPLLFSGVVGIFAGDTLLFAALNRLGPRKTGVIFALNAPMAALLGYALLGEVLAAQAVVGILLIVGGVITAILYGRRRTDVHAWETVKGSLWVGVALGLGAALGQAVGAILARPVMAGGMDPFLASMVRVGIAALLLTALTALPFASVKPRKAALTPQVALLTALTGLLGLGVGMTLLLFALSGGKVGIVSTLSATTPVIILPMLWAHTGERPTAGAWIGAVSVVAGMALLFLR
nr:DMT family transporter [Tianweitania sediminis]